MGQKLWTCTHGQTRHGNFNIPTPLPLPTLLHLQGSINIPAKSYIYTEIIQRFIKKSVHTHTHARTLACTHTHTLRHKHKLTKKIFKDSTANLYWNSDSQHKHTHKLSDKGHAAFLQGADDLRSHQVRILFSEILKSKACV